MESERGEGRKEGRKLSEAASARTLWMCCLHDLEGPQHDILCNTPNKCLRVFFLVQILMKEAHMSHTCCPLKALTCKGYAVIFLVKVVFSLHLVVTAAKSI